MRDQLIHYYAGFNNTPIIVCDEKKNSRYE